MLRRSWPYAALLVLFGLLILAATWGSQHPYPGGWKNRQPIQIQPQSDQRPSARDERHIQTPPLSVDGKAATTDEAERAADKKERNEKASVDWRLMFYTGLLALFTFLLFGATAVQVGLFFWQLRLIRTSVADAKRAAQAAGESAGYLRAAERAHVYGGFGERRDGRVFPNLNNYGKTPAFVTRIAVGVAHLHSLPEQPQFSDEIRPGFVLGPGAQSFGVQNVSATYDGSPGEVFYGRVWYRDMFDNEEHFSSFIIDLSTGLGVLQQPGYWDWS